MRRSALNLSYDEEPLPDINPDTLDVRVVSGLFAAVQTFTAHNMQMKKRNQILVKTI